MTVRERMFELVEPAEVDEFLQRFPTGVLFKAGGCHKTMQGFSYVESALQKRPQIHVGLIKVIESRPASNHVAELTQITHESPQFILFIDGRAVFDLDNWDITPEALEEGLAAHLGQAEEKASASSSSDLSQYVDLLQNFIDGKLMEEEFEARWLEMFQKDSEPRSQQEFELLNSLYGDVDAALVQLGGKKNVRECAEQLLKHIAIG